MKNYVIGMSAILLIVTLGSCQKENSGDDGGGASAVNDSTYLSRFVILDTTYSSGLDTGTVFKFSYDSKKRLSEIFRASYVAGTHNIDYQSWETRVYNGNETVPYKIIKKTDDPLLGDVDTDTLFLFYNSSMIVQRDSSVGYTNGDIDTRIATEYRSSGANRMTQVSNIYIGTDPVPVRTLSTDINNLLSGGNLVSYSDSFYVLNPAADFKQTVAGDFSYDTKANPFSKFNIPYPLYSSKNSYKNDLSEECFTNPSRNNLVSFMYTTRTVVGTSNTVSNTMRYEYTNAGLPSVIRYAASSDRATRKDKLFYVKL